MADATSAPADSIPAASQLEQVYPPDVLERRRQAIARATAGFEGVDATDPKGPVGHARGIHTSTRLTSNYRETHRRESMDVTPQEVIDVLVGVGVKNWVLMGLHGYVGYLSQPRATQDVDVMVGYNERKKAQKAIAERWPGLQVRELSQVVRFLDPNDLDSDGRPQPVIDLMSPWSPFQKAILKEHVTVEAETGHRLPTLEAAVVSKYATLISPYRDDEKKHFDAGDFSRIVRGNYDRIDREALQRLASTIWEGASEEVLEFVETVRQGKPLRV